MLTSSMVRMTKGAAASIILLLIAEPAGGNQEWIERYTGYTDKSVSQALKFLLEVGVVSQAGPRGEYIYRLVTAERQLPLPVEEIEEGNLTTEITEKDEQEEKSIFFEKIESENLRLAALLASGSSLTSQESSLNNLLPLEEAVESEKFRLEKVLDRHGIRNPARARLLAGNYEYEMVLAHLLFSDNGGQAIYRIENDWPIDRKRYRDWWGFHCPDCLQERSACECTFEDDEEIDEEIGKENTR